MVDYQPYLGLPCRSYNSLTEKEKSFIDYFTKVKMSTISRVMDELYTAGPKGYGSSLILARMIKIKERISSDRELADKLSRNELYRFITHMGHDHIPAHNTFNSLRTRLGVDGLKKIHGNFVLSANSLGLLTPIIRGFPKNMRKGIILIADSTFLLTSGSTKGIKSEDGSWLFKDQGAAFGRPHHKHKYPVGYKSHSLITINGIPMVSLLSGANEYDTDYIFPLLEELRKRYPKLMFSYIILDKGYDSEEIYRGIYENFDIIPVIIRKKMVYPKGFTSNGLPLCPFNYPMKRKGIDYRHKRTQYACFKVCQKEEQKPLFDCKPLYSTNRFGYALYTYFEHSYRKFGPALPNTIIYKRLKRFRTGIERTYALVKENRYRMETSNTYVGHDNVLMHVIEHDIVLTQDIIYDYLNNGQVSPIIKP
jgi:hypothetical protein